MRPSEQTAKVLMPRSTPICRGDWPGRYRSGSARSTSTVNEQYHRPALRVTVADRMRAVPAARRRARRPVCSAVRTSPTLGRVLWRPSASTRMAPVVKRIDGVARSRFLNRGKPTRRPLRAPFFDAL